MLADAPRRYSFLDRDGRPLDLDRSEAFDQYGPRRGPDLDGLTSIVVISAERGADTRRCVDSILAGTPETLEVIKALEDARGGSVPAFKRFL